MRAFLPLINSAVGAAATVAAAMGVVVLIVLVPGTSATVQCQGDELVVTQNGTEASLDCVAYTAVPTATSVPPTATLIPTDTPVPPTATSVPPTATPVPSAQPTATPSVPSTSFLDTFDGAPERPTSWRGSQWDVTVHSRDRETLYQLESMDAQHGPNCEPPMATHRISSYEDAVFQCKDHVMTAIKAGGYGLIYLTPAEQVDFTNGTAVIRWDVSTLRTSNRDWIDLYVSPMDDHLQLPLEDWLPDLNGQPKRAVHIKMEDFNGGSSFSAEVLRNFDGSGLDNLWWVRYEDVLTPDAKVRSTFELQISRTHIKFGMPDYDLWWVDTDIEPLDWTVGVVQFGHHSYNPEKDCLLAGGCSANTWHWDNVSINPAKPFTMIHATQRYVTQQTGGTVTFESPAPQNARLRFAGIGEHLEVSFDGGQTWQAAQMRPQMKHPAEAFASYFTPMPAGVQTVLFRGDNWWGGEWHVRDLSIWAE